jgi:hypothetical protein
MTREPSTVVSLVTALLSALVTLAVAFGAEIDDAQRDAVLTAGGALCLVIAALGPVIRQFVVSPQTAANAVVMAKQDVGPTRDVPAINVAGGTYAAAVREMGFVVKPPPAG